MTCNRCGKCCKSKTLLEQCTPEEEELFRSIYKSLGKDIENTICKNLYYIVGLAACKIYKDRPDFCQQYYCNKAQEIEISTQLKETD